MKTRNESLYIYDILECCDTIASYIADVSDIEFQNNKMMQDALVRNIEVIGEAAKNLSKELRDDNPEISWSQIMRMRDKIVHHYFRINLDFVWQTVKQDIPVLRNQIEKIYVAQDAS